MVSMLLKWTVNEDISKHLRLEQVRHGFSIVFIPLTGTHTHSRDLKHKLLRPGRGTQSLDLLCTE